MLPETGSISMSQVNVELKKGETTVITLNDTDVRKLAGKPSGTISMGDLRGKKASEYVENYQIYHNEWFGKMEKGTFTISFPKKIINGKLIVRGGFESSMPDISYIEILGVKCTNFTKKEIVCAEGTTTLKGTYYTGANRGNNGNYTSGQCKCDIKFTGEWEA